MSDEDLLDTLLSAATDELTEDKPKVTHKSLKETNIFTQESNLPNTNTKPPKDDKKSSVIHSGDTDSSDDEDNKYYEDRKYNSYGKDVKHLLSSAPSTSTSGLSLNRESSWKTKPNKELALKPAPTPKIQEAHFDPVFGLRIVNPLVSSATLKERMLGREAVPFSRIKKFAMGNVPDKNWVIGGVIVNKSAVRTSQKGNQFLIWTLSDLKDDIKTVSMFLFGSAYKNLWKTAVGTVIGVLNPSILDKKDTSKDEACLSVDNVQKVMILGQSKDLGTCKSTKKNGEQCTAIVNISRCEFCVYHIKQEYQKCSKRSELQSSFAGKGLTALRNKVLGKDEVFYAGKSYTAIPAKRSRKLEQKDNNRLKSLSGSAPGFPAASVPKTNKPKRGVASNLDISQNQRLRDLQLLERLGGVRDDTKTLFNGSHSSEVTLESSKSFALNAIAKLKAPKEDNLVKKTPELETGIKTTQNTEELKAKLGDNEGFCKSNSLSMGTPMLSSGSNGIIDLSAPVSSKQANRAKINALKYIQKHGALKKSDPNSIKSPTSKKRALENIENTQNNEKKQKIDENGFISDRFKKMMEAQSKHMDLLEQHDNEEQDKYFYKLEAKERMEEKMASTYKVACKAVRCLKCKYTNFSAAQLCKDEKHPLRVFDAMKRFFKCGNCENRTVSLDIIPTSGCKNCGSSKWERTGMMKEKTAVLKPNLSIRGGEQTFINSVITDVNINLLVPDL